MKKFLIVFTLLAVSYATFRFTEAGQQRQICKGACPNIVLLMVDTLRADKLGTYGLDIGTSPEIDALARRGAVFENTISQASWTRPSVASIVTSRYPRSLGVLKEKWDVMPEAPITLAEAFRAGGYSTVGLTANPQLNTVFGFAQGFDRYSDSTVIFGWMKNETGKVKASRKSPIKMSGEILPEALKALKETPGPVYLQLMLMDVHAHSRVEMEAVDEDLRANPDAQYLQAVRNVSKEIGAFIAALEQDEQLRNTIIVLTADHGEGLHDHPDVPGSRGHGNLLYKSTTHIPLIVTDLSGQLIKPGRVAGTYEALDIMPTLLEVAGLPVPVGLDGISQAAHLNGGDGTAEKRLAFTETRWRERVNKVAVIDDSWLYVENRDSWKATAPVELQSFRESQNGAQTNRSDQHPAVVTHMQSKLKEWEDKVVSPAAGSGAEISDQEMKQLKSLGYL